MISHNSYTSSKSTSSSAIFHTNTVRYVSENIIKYHFNTAFKPAWAVVTPRDRLFARFMRTLNIKWTRNDISVESLVVGTAVGY